MAKVKIKQPEEVEAEIASTKLCEQLISWSKPTRSEELAPEKEGGKPRTRFIYVCPACKYEHKLVGTNEIKGGFTCFAAIQAPEKKKEEKK